MGICKVLGSHRNTAVGVFTSGRRHSLGAVLDLAGRGLLEYNPCVALRWLVFKFREMGSLSVDDD